MRYLIGHVGFEISILSKKKKKKKKKDFQLRSAHNVIVSEFQYNFLKQFSKPSNGCIILHFFRLQKVVLFLVENGATVDAKNSNMTTPFFNSVEGLHRGISQVRQYDREFSARFKEKDTVSSWLVEPFSGIKFPFW